MNIFGNALGPVARGMLVRGGQWLGAATARASLLERLDATDLLSHVDAVCGFDADGPFLRLWIDDVTAQVWAPGQNTLQLADTLHLDSQKAVPDLIREIVVTLLLAPQVVEFPSVEELVSAIRIRCNIVQAAQKTKLAFHTSEASRPQDCWTYDDDHGFVILPGVSLITAMAKATQPALSGSLYAFSCYRATEYVIVLGIAQELESSNPALLQQLQLFWTRRPIRSGEFHTVFLREQGSMEAPLPPCYFVPGDRTWFRNPDEASAEASGFEGSWVMYLGGGLFTNFWKGDQPYTLSQKCLEIYHWRHGLYRDRDGDERVNEDVVAACVERTRKDPAELARIMAIMQRYREPRGVYTEAGGCLDTTRESARWVHPATTDLVLPGY